MHVQIVPFVESFSAVVTNDFLETLVNIFMHFETADLSEFLITTRHCALVWLLACVSSEMHEEFKDALDSTVAYSTVESLVLTNKQLHLFLQIGGRLDIVQNKVAAGRAGSFVVEHLWVEIFPIDNANERTTINLVLHYEGFGKGFLYLAELERRILLLRCKVCRVLLLENIGKLNGLGLELIVMTNNFLLIV